jgi:hypothetical protein
MFPSTLKRAERSESPLAESGTLMEIDSRAVQLRSKGLNRTRRRRHQNGGTQVGTQSADFVTESIANELPKPGSTRTVVESRRNELREGKLEGELRARLERSAASGVQIRFIMSPSSLSDSH